MSRSFSSRHLFISDVSGNYDYLHFINSTSDNGNAIPFAEIYLPGNSSSTRISLSFHFAVRAVLQQKIFIFVSHSKFHFLTVI